MSFIFERWKGGGFDDSAIGGIIEAAKATAPSCREWVDSIAEFVQTCSKSGDWLHELFSAQKLGKHVRFLGQDFLSRLAKLKGPEDIEPAALDSRSCW